MNTLRFPNISIEKQTDSNPAVRAFGRRFYKDQTPLEYLAEFLLCFSSKKESEAGERAGSTVMGESQKVFFFVF